MNNVKYRSKPQWFKQTGFGSKGKDFFSLAVPLIIPKWEAQTGRTVLSQLAGIYDPLGWICPSVLPLRQLFHCFCKAE